MKLSSGCVLIYETVGSICNVDSRGGRDNLLGLRFEASGSARGARFQMRLVRSDNESECSETRVQVLLAETASRPFLRVCPHPFHGFRHM